MIGDTRPFLPQKDPQSKWLPPETNKRYLFKLCVGSSLKLVQALKNTATLLCLPEKIKGTLRFSLKWAEVPLLKFHTNRNYFVRFLTDLRILIRTSLRIEARLAKHDSHQTGRIAWSLSSKGGIWSIRPILKSKSSQASLEVSGSALHAEDQQCEREGPYDMTIWTGPEAEKKNTLERMLFLHYDRQRKKVKSPFDFSRAFLLNKNSGFNLWNFLVEHHFSEFTGKTMTTEKEFSFYLTVDGFFGKCPGNFRVICPGFQSRWIFGRMESARSHKLQQWTIFHSTCDLIQLLICVGRRERRFARSADSEASRMT